MFAGLKPTFSVSAVYSVFAALSLTHLVPRFMPKSVSYVPFHFGQRSLTLTISLYYIVLSYSVFLKVFLTKAVL
jgi:hypothetical protein